ncbi:MAG: PKD domain-containing protein [Flavobacteriales bacterium]|nr:PKD domain-containing protein [Flavobacteriales bacterium]
MATMNNGIDPFEQKLKDSLEQYEVPYNSSDWAQMEKALNGDRKGWWLGGLGLSIIAAGTLLVGGGAWYMFAGNDADGLNAVAENGAVVSATPGNVKNTATDVSELNTANDPENGASAVQTATLTSSEKAPINTSPDLERSKAVLDPTAQKSNNPVASKIELKPATKPVTAIAASSASNSSSASEKNSFSTSVKEGCSGTSVEFKVSHMPEDGIYLWNFGDGNFSNKANPEHTFTKPGSYQVMLSMSAAGVGTIQNKPSSDVIVIHEAPKALFNVLKQEYDGHLPSVHFENRSMAGKQYLWDFGDGQTSTIAHPDHIYKKKGVYQVELIVTNEIGCEDRLMKDVRIDKDYNLDAPASFSPNGDGKDDTFIPEALRSLGVKFNLAIYSATGSLLFQSNDPTKPWTGRTNNRGEINETGEYVWVVDVRESLHLAETYTGKVQLIK